MMKVEVDNSDWIEVIEVRGQESLTPEIYYLLSEQDRSELEDLRTRKKVLNKLKLEGFFEHEELSQLELFLVREDRKREQEKELQSANIEISGKHAVIQRFLQRRTTQEEEEDERIRQREIRDAIEEHEETEEEDEAEIIRRAEEFLLRIAALALLERRLEEARERLEGGGGGGARVEEVNTSDEDGTSQDEGLSSESIEGTTSATSTIASRNKTDRENNNPIATQPGRGSGRRSVKKDKRNSTSGGEGCADVKEDKKKSGIWDCIISCVCCCI